MLISEPYRQLNQRMHEEDPCYGSSGQKMARRVAMACRDLNTADILDYGCGKRGLEQALGFPIKNYDPCIPGLDKPPVPADVVVCGDVLEHIEPDCLDEVLKDIYRVTRQIAILLIANRPALKALPDGRNAHLIQEGPQWWLAKLWGHGFRILEFKSLRNQGCEIAFVVLVDKES